MNPNQQNKPNNRPRHDVRPEGSRSRKTTNEPGNGQQRSGISRGAAIRAQRRSQEDAQKIANQYAAANPDNGQPDRRRANLIVDDFDKLKVTFLGGLEDVGEKNMAVIEYRNDAIILDCGNHLGIDLPGINYSIADPAYLEGIRQKIKAYVVTHGHLDHVGGLKHIVPRFPAPIYGSRFSIGIVEKTFEEDLPDAGNNPNFSLQTVVMNMDNHERLKIGEFTVELLRITHSILKNAYFLPVNSRAAAFMLSCRRPRSSIATSLTVTRSPSLTTSLGLPTRSSAISLT